MKHVEETEQLLSMAKLLRRSTDDATRKDLYINPYLTRAEAAAAYQVRVQRRLKAKQHTTQTNNSRGGTNSSTAASHASPVATDVLPDHRQLTTNQGSRLNPLAGPFNSISAKFSSVAADGDTKIQPNTASE
jgi:hypothetical protein